MEDGDAEDVPPIIYIIAGCGAGAIEAIATWPTEYIKTKLQLQKQMQDNIVKNRKTFATPATVDALRDDGLYVSPVIELTKVPLQKQIQDNIVKNRKTFASPATVDDGLLYVAPVIELMSSDLSQQKDGSCFDVLELEIVKSVDSLLEDPPLILLPYTDMISGISYTVRTLGFFALYYGLTPTLLGSIPKAGIRFGMFSWFSHLLEDDHGVLSIQMTFLAGCLAGVFEALLVVVPVETIKTKCIQLDMPFWEGLQEIILVEGIGGVYTGGLATVIKQASNHGLRFVWYSEYKNMVTQNGAIALTPVMAFVGGMTAGIFSALGNQPADVIKTRMQGVRPVYISTWDCIRKTFEDEGAAGFYTGIVPRLSRVIPGQGILFLSYEMIVSALLSFYS